MNKIFKVAKILDKYSVIINAGENDINVGDFLEIFAADVIVVKDPDTKEVLGNYDYVKATVVATKVDKKMSICANSKKTSVFDSALDMSAFARKTSELNVDFEAMTDNFETVDRVIRVGDLVRPINKTIQAQSECFDTTN